MSLLKEKRLPFASLWSLSVKYLLSFNWHCSQKKHIGADECYKFSLLKFVHVWIFCKVDFAVIRAKQPSLFVCFLSINQSIKPFSVLWLLYWSITSNDWHCFYTLHWQSRRGKESVSCLLNYRMGNTHFCQSLNPYCFLYMRQIYVRCFALSPATPLFPCDKTKSRK